MPLLLDEGFRVAFKYMTIFISLMMVSPTILSDSSGPVFRGVGNMYADLVPTNQPVNCSFAPSVVVQDNDGVDSVIACYKNQSTTTWLNSTMVWVRHIDEGEDAGFEQYAANLANFTMDRNHWLVIWNIRYYANDTFDNWVESATMNYSFRYFYEENNSYTSYQFPLVETVILLALGIFGLLALVIIIRKLIDR